MNPMVSVLIPTYNRKEMTIEAVESVLKQTYQDYEVIVIDNCSIDDTYFALEDIYGNNAKVKLYQNSSNIGIVKNWIKALRCARGKYCKILFSDDRIEPTFLEETIKALETHEECGFAITRNSFVEGNSSIPYEFSNLIADKTGVLTKDYYYQCDIFGGSMGCLPVSPGCALFRTRDVHICPQIENEVGIDFSKTGAGIDLWIFLTALEKYDFFYYITTSLSVFRKHPGSESIKKDLTGEYNLAIYIWFLKHPELNSRYGQKFIFSLNNRILNLNNTVSEIKTSITRSLSALNFDNLIQYFNDKEYRKISIYGFGNNGRIIADRLLEAGINVIEFIDRDYMQKGNYRNINVVGVEDMKKDTDVVIVTPLQEQSAIISSVKQICKDTDCLCMQDLLII